MMGLSFWKLAILAALAYWLWRWLRSPPRPIGGGGSTATGPAEQAAKIKAVDLEKCPKCGAYVSVGSGRGCSREDCPSL